MTKRITIETIVERVRGALPQDVRTSLERGELTTLHGSWHVHDVVTRIAMEVIRDMKRSEEWLEQLLGDILHTEVAMCGARRALCHHVVTVITSPTNR